MIDPIIITGPTASGKTGLSLDIAHKLHATIISADSRMVYSGLDIGTGKPTWEHRQLADSPWIAPEQLAAPGPVYEIAGTNHYLLDCAVPGRPFSLAEWLSSARAIIHTLQQQGEQVLIVGGTGLYLKALLEGYVLPPADPKVREEIERLTDHQLMSKLARVDPVTAEREQHNRRRLVRALEIYHLTGKPASQPSRTVGFPNAQVIVLDPPRKDLFARIDKRIQERLDQGMVKEVAGLIASGVSGEWLRSLGLEYRIITDWLASEQQDQEELITELRTDIRAYARRQATFFRTQLRPTLVLEQPASQRLASHLARL